MAHPLYIHYIHYIHRPTKCPVCYLLVLYRNVQNWGSRNSAVGIATAYGLDDRGVGVRGPVESRIFSPQRRPDRLLDPSSLLSNGYRGALSPVVKRTGREADHSPPTSAVVKKTWIYTYTLR
jgi:hypothetical protein